MNTVSERKKGSVRIGSREIILLILLAAAIRMVLSVLMRPAFPLEGDLVSLRLARSLWAGQGVSLYLQPARSLQWLFALLLSPFYAIPEASVRLTAMAVFSGLLISSALIPAALLALKLIRQPKYQLLALLILAVSPNLCFSQVISPASLYLPLLLWGYYWLFRLLESPKCSLGLAALLGFWGFLLWFTQETGLAFLLACALVLPAALHADEGSGKGKGASAAVFFGAALLPALLLCFLFPANLGTPITASVAAGGFQRTGQLLYILLSSVFMLLCFGLSCFFFPVVLPLVFRKSSTSSESSFLKASCLYVLFAALLGMLALSARESFSADGFFAHQGILLGGSFPFLLCFLGQVPEWSNAPAKRKPLLLSVLAFSLLGLLFLRLPAFSGPLDSPVLTVARRFSVRLASPWIWKLAPALLAAAGAALLLRRKPKVFLGILLPCLLAFELANTAVLCREIRRVSPAPDDSLLQEMRTLDRFLDTLDAPVTVIQDHGDEALVSALDAWTDDSYRALSYQGVHDTSVAAGQSGPVPLGSFVFPAAADGLAPYELSEVKYLLVHTARERFDYDAYADITPEGVTCCRILKASDPGVLAMYDPYEYEIGTAITFYEPRPSYLLLGHSGFFEGESPFSWTVGNEASLLLKPLPEEAADLTTDLSWGALNGEQHCQIYAGDTLVYDGLLTPDMSGLTFDIPAASWNEAGRISLRFLFPDARQPENGDSRLLAVAFRSLLLNYKE